MSQNYGQPQNKPTKAPMRPMRPPMSMHTQPVGPFTQVYQNPPRVQYPQPTYTNQQFFQPSNVVFQQQMQQPVNTTMPQQSNQGNQSNAPRKPPVVPSNPSMRQRFNNPPITSNNPVSISMNPVPNEQSLQMPSNVVSQHSNRPNIPPQPQNQNQPVNGSTINITTSMQGTNNVNQQNLTSNQVQSNQISMKAPIVTINTKQQNVSSNIPKTNNTNTSSTTNNNQSQSQQLNQQSNQQSNQQQQQSPQQQSPKQQSSNQQQKQSTPESTSPQSRSPNRSKTKQPRKSPQIRQNPWEQFTGKKSNPTYYSWAQSTRQVLSGDTLQLALPKPPTKPYQSAKLIFMTLDGIRTPRVQRREPKEGEKDKIEEQPYGFEAREFVRSAVGTKPVYLKIINHLDIMVMYILQQEMVKENH
jgi:hypothetical protein